jgi:signal transduction histidine kinase
MMQRSPHALDRGAAWLALVVVLVLTALAWHGERANAAKEAQDAFDARATEIAFRIQQRMVAYEQVLRGASALFAASPQLTRDQWRRYVAALGLERTFPGIQGVGYAVRVPPSEKDGHIRAARAQGFPGYRIRPEGEREEYGVILLLEPFTGENRQALGYDLLSHPASRAAMVQARDTGLAAITRRMSLIQGAAVAPQTGFLMVLPVYAGGASLRTVAERRAALVGWVYAPFRMEDLMRGIFGEPAADLVMRLYDGGEPAEAALMLAQDTGTARVLPSRFERTTTFYVNDRPWTLYVASLPLFETRIESRRPLVVLLGGILTGGLVFGMLWALARTRDRAVSLAADMTEANRRLSEGIVERERAERERADALARERRAREEAEAASQAKDEFLAIVSHELRTPLNAIQGWVHILRQNEPVGRETVERATAVIQRNVEAQVKLVDDLLDTARIGSGKLKLDMRPVRLAEVIRAAVDGVRPAADAKQIDLRTRLAAAEAEVTGDAQRLQQIVWNLLTNAVKFTPKGGAIEVRLERADARARITVTDSGEGIAPDFLPFVFEPFRQADSSSRRRYGGLGLGLALVKHLAELHGGSVAAASRGMGAGAAFTFELPIRPQRVAPASVPRTIGAERAATRGARLEGLRVLAIDDQADARELIAVILEREGARVHAVGSAAAATAYLGGAMSGSRPDVILCDIELPDEDGYAFLATLRRMEEARGVPREARIPAIALTAYARAEDRERARVAGFAAHVAKPVDPDRLIALIAERARQSPIVRSQSA